MLAPRWAKPWAVARPIPRLAPVTTQTRPLRSVVMNGGSSQVGSEPAEGGVKHDFELGSSGAPRMDGAERMSCTLYCQQPAVGTHTRRLQPFRLGKADRLVRRPMDDEPGNR